jgi:hypothetical protein
MKGTLNFSKVTSSGIVPAVVNIKTQSAANIAANLLIKVKGGDTSVAFNELSVVPPFENGLTATMTVVGITTNEVAVH